MSGQEGTISERKFHLQTNIFKGHVLVFGGVHDIASLVFTWNGADHMT